jgi:hypothetical protein
VTATKTQQDYQGMRVFVLDEAVQSGLRVRPPIRIWEVEWDGGAAEPITTDHVIKISSKNSHVETKIPHGDPKDPEWRFLTRARVEDAVSTLASQTT